MVSGGMAMTPDIRERKVSERRKVSEETCGIA